MWLNISVSTRCQEKTDKSHQRWNKNKQWEPSPQRQLLPERTLCLSDMLVLFGIGINLSRSLLWISLTHSLATPMPSRRSLTITRYANLEFSFSSSSQLLFSHREIGRGGGEGGTKKLNAVYYYRTYLAIQDPVCLQPLLWDRGRLLIEGHWYSGRSRIKEHCSVRPRCLFWYSYLPLCVSASTLISCSASSAFGLNILM